MPLSDFFNFDSPNWSPSAVESGLSGKEQDFSEFRRNQVLQAAAMGAMRQLGSGASTSQILLASGLGATAGGFGAKDAWEQKTQENKRNALEELLKTAQVQEALNPKPLSTAGKLEEDLRSGKISQEVYRAERQRLMQSGGTNITISPQMPGLGQSDPFREKLAEKMAGTYAEELQSYQDAANKYTNMRQALRQLQAGKGEFTTGALANARGLIGQIAALSGLPEESIPNLINPRGYATVASADSQIRLAFMEAAKGNLNAEEMRVMGTVGPGLLYSNSGNDTLIKTFDALADRAELKADFFNQAAMSGYNILSGEPIDPSKAKVEWNKYVKNTPLFGEDILREMEGNSVKDINRRLMYAMPPEWVRTAPEHEIFTMLPPETDKLQEYMKFLLKNNPELYHAIEAKLTAGETP